MLTHEHTYQHPLHVLYICLDTIAAYWYVTDDVMNYTGMLILHALSFLYKNSIPCVLFKIP